MAKGINAKKNVKKEPAKTPKEKKAEKKLAILIARNNDTLILTEVNSK